MSNIKLSPRIKYNLYFKNLKLSPRNFDNIVNLDGIDYQLKYFNGKPGNKGGNSMIYSLENPNEDFSGLIVKISNLPVQKSSLKYQRRFQREILALDKAKKSGCEYIVEYYHNGNFFVDNYTFPFYTMEKADYDLTNFLQSQEIEINQKIVLCKDILKGFRDLHELKIYHRDIKHDNILFIQNRCKVSDLGLARFREDDFDFVVQEKGERIGAFGWESPETMNKFLTERYDDSKFDCEIDYQSDIFQLGKLFWYIFQGNLPIGQLERQDFILDDDDIYNLIIRMLQYSKKENRRPKSIEDIEEIIRPIAKKYAVI